MIPTIGKWAPAPDGIEPLVGYRAWRYRTSERGAQLFPLNQLPDDPSPMMDWEGSWSFG
jgi:hypothetical protein